MSSRRKIAVATIAAGAAAVVWIVGPWVVTTAFLLDLAGSRGTLRRVLPVVTHAVVSRDVTIPTRTGPLAARLFLPEGAVSARTAIVFPGIHGGGVDEPRLVTFSTRLAATGVTVLTVPLPDLREFRVVGRSTDQIEDATRWMTDDRALSPRGRTTLVGISFSGGLALVAAGRPSLEGRLDAIVAVGPHGDLARALHFLCTGRLPDGTTRMPHDYGLAVIALDAAPVLVPRDQVEPFERGVRTFLEASLDDSAAQTRARALVADARAQAAALPDPAAGLLRAVVDRDVRTLGARLDPLIDGLTRDAALSPERSPVPHAPVYLLHGADDNVIPSSETTSLAADLRARGAHVESLVTRAVSHVGVDPSVSLAERWRLLRFWRDVLRALGS